MFFFRWTKSEKNGRCDKRAPDVKIFPRRRLARLGRLSVAISAPTTLAADGFCERLTALCPELNAAVYPGYEPLAGAGRPHLVQLSLGMISGRAEDRNKYTRWADHDLQ